MYQFSRLNGSFSKLKELAETAEKYYKHDPNIAIIKMRQFGEDFVKLVAARENFSLQTPNQTKEPTQEIKIRMLQQYNYIPENVAENLHRIRQIGNKAAHEASYGTVPIAHKTLHLASEISEWLIVRYNLQPKPKAKPKPQSQQKPQQKNKPQTVPVYTSTPNTNRKNKTSSQRPRKEFNQRRPRASSEAAERLLPISLLLLCISSVEFYSRIFIGIHYGSNKGNPAIIQFTNTYLVNDAGNYIFSPLMFNLALAACIFHLIATGMLTLYRERSKKLRKHYLWSWIISGIIFFHHGVILLVDWAMKYA